MRKDYWLGVRPLALMQSSKAFALLPTPASADLRSHSVVSRLSVFALLLSLGPGGGGLAHPAKSIIAANNPSFMNRFLSSSPGREGERIELTLHGDPLLAHLERDFDTFKIQSHFFDAQLGAAHAIDLIHVVKSLPAPDNRGDHLVTFRAHDESCVHGASFGDSRGVNICVPSVDFPLQLYIFAHVAAVGLVDLVDQFVGNLFLRDAHHEPQI